MNLSESNHLSEGGTMDPMTTETAEMFRRQRDEAVAEVDRLRAWIDTEGRNCPSRSTIDMLLGYKTTE